MKRCLSNVLWVLVMIGIFQVSCGVKETAESLEESTKRIEDRSGQLAERTEELLKGMRKVESLNTLDLARKDLLASDGTTLKIQKATVFFAAFEFQEWTGRFTDTPQELDELYSLAVKLFFTSIDDLIEDDLPISPNIPGNTWLSLASLAATMGHIEPKQDKTLDTPVSMYGLLVNALEMEERVNRGEAVPKYVLRVLEWKQEAIYMLQLRHNYFPAMVLARMTPFEENFVFRAKQRFWGSSISLEQFSIPQFQEWTRWLQDGVATQDTLKKLGIAPEFTDCIRDSFNNLEIIPDIGLQSDAKSEFLKQFAIYSLSGVD